MRDVMQNLLDGENVMFDMTMTLHFENLNAGVKSLESTGC